MKKAFLSSVLAAVLLFGFTQNALSQSCPIIPFAVVELFTSQGCSYCPAADEALDSIIVQEKASGRNVICIAEHVTYWNGQWFDPFSDPQFSPRQTVYCQYMGVPKGTPEAFVNGKMIVTPSPTIPSLQAAVNTQLAGIATAGVCINLQTPASSPTLTVSYDLSGNYTGNNLIVCLVEDGLVSHPTSGENAGATLNESGVSRVFKVTPISSSSGVVNIVPPANCVRNNSRIVAYVQNPTTMMIYGATKGIDLSSVTTAVSEPDADASLTMFPNPAVSEVFVQGNFPANSVYSVSNAMGSKVLEGTVSPATYISLNGLDKGVYYLRIDGGLTPLVKMISKY